MTTADQILRDTLATVEITFTAGDATGTVAYTVTGPGDTVVQSGVAINETEPGRYTFTLAPQSQVQPLTIRWTGVWATVSQTITTYAEIVGGHLFTVAEARAFDRAKLASTTSYPDAAIREARAGIADMFEQCAGVSFIPRYHQETLDGRRNLDDLLVTKTQVRRVLTATVDGDELLGTDLTDIGVYEHGKLYRSAGWGCARRGVTVAYEHGYDATPWEIHQAALTLLVYVLIASDITNRAISFTNDVGGFVRLSVPSVDYPTGIPTVDAALNRYAARMVLV